MKKPYGFRFYRDLIVISIVFSLFVLLGSIIAIISNTTLLSSFLGMMTVCFIALIVLEKDAEDVLGRLPKFIKELLTASLVIFFMSYGLTKVFLLC